MNPNDNSESKISEIVPQEPYCVKCKTKRQIKNPEETMMKNGRPAIKDFVRYTNPKFSELEK